MPQNESKDKYTYLAQWAQTSLAFFEWLSIDFDHFKLDPPTLKTFDFRSENPFIDLV